MRREPASSLPGRVLHVVGPVTDEVFSFLGPATHALARTGREQAIVMIDEPRCRQHVPRLHESAELVLVPRLRNPLKQWRAMRLACRAAMAAAPLHAVHLHGLLPGLVGAVSVQGAKSRAPVFFSPHGSRTIGALRGLGAWALIAFRSLLPTTARRAAIVNVPQETRIFERWQSAELIESPVGDVFFAVPRNEARHPLIVTGGRAQGARNAELLAQLAVLLSGEALRISFNWIGAVDAVSHQRLNAAGVGVFDAVSDAECASRLATGWVYLAPGGTRGFPLFLVEAMAAGLPCVAMDCVQHRTLIDDGATGFLCTSEQQMMARIASLVDDAALRQRLGAAARERAGQRFSETRFSAQLLAAYALPG
jgi:glycosyltransferase involved in cell wall biosynthesis